MMRHNTTSTYKRLIPILALSASLIAGCGSDSDNELTIQPPDPGNGNSEESTPPKPEYFDLNVKPDAKSIGTMKVMFGRFDDKINIWLHNPEGGMAPGSAELDGIKGPAANPKDPEEKRFYAADTRDAHVAGIYNDPHPYQIDLDLEKVAEVLATNPDGLGAGTARPDIFREGHYSAFDLLRYLAATRDDIRLSNVVHYSETGLGTYTFDVSWDRNRNGVFDASECEPDNPHKCDAVDDPNWHFRFINHGGKFKRAKGNMQGKSPSGEGNYLRIDEFWIQPGALVTFESMSEVMTARRHWIQKEQVDVFKANGNVAKVNVRVIGDNWQHLGTVMEREITPHNHRSDVYQDGVLTTMDALLSAKELDIKFSWWGTLSTGAVVNHYAISSAAGVKTSGFKGFGLMQMNPSLAALSDMPDFGFTKNDFGMYPSCLFDLNGATLPKEQADKILAREARSPVDMKTCVLDWSGVFGGAILHQMADAYPLNYGHMNILLLRNNLGPQFGLPEEKIREGGERVIWDLDKGPGEDLVTLQTMQLPEEPVGKAPILDQTHFGWKVADCTLCHNDEQSPNGHGGFAWPVNSADGFDEPQPYYCATCHGSNGAPISHGENDRCFWCHSNDGFVPENHNDASTMHLYTETAEQPLEGNDGIDISFRSRGIPVDDSGNHKRVKETWDSKNNDWDLSKVFPDPYSCLTCHPKQQAN